ncbi:glycosyltransferase family 39 protein [Dyadobacter sp. CY345]|uniref:glycosyltransferase family 39 protein n=1 Tax=Dyadobacter sp. CY345 TaxID=2909335 RepID=UPI001F2031F0|nr:glycosyltransferase family 39 protein [Dyadobacter sp. CY345]MCF2444152.1 glycosyltransferase family 39 protein [Dyadobacter sp. CY345]
MTKTFTSSKNIFKNHRFPILLILFAGFFFRVFHYLNNRSLWEDEVFLASSLIRMNFTELATLPLDYQQRAPIGFLWLAHLGVFFFDKKELSLRLFPFVAGIAALFTFVPVARYFLRSNQSIFAAIFVVALAPPIIYHAVEVKQYGTEFFASVLSLYLYTHFVQKDNIKDLLIWGILGAIILWFSFSSLFVLFGMAGSVCLTCLIKKEWKQLFLYMIPFSVWLISFLIQYAFFISKFPEEEWLIQFWRNRDAFMPIPPHSVKDLLWPFKQIYSLVRYPMGLTWFDLDYKNDYSDKLRILARMPALPILTGLLGLWTLLKKERKHLLLFALPVILALIASALEFYPLRERLTVFLSPIFILVIGKGVENIYTWPVSAWAKKIFLCALLAAPLLNSTLQMIDPELFGDYKKSSQREAMQYLQKNYQAGDVVYVYWNNQPSFRYYQQAYGFNFKTVFGSDVRYVSHNFDSYFKNLSSDFKKLNGSRRLWYAYKPYNGIKIGDIEKEPKWYYYKVDAVKKMLEKISSFGVLKDSYPSRETGTDVKLYLFELDPERRL